MRSILAHKEFTTLFLPLLRQIYRTQADFAMLRSCLSSRTLNHIRTKSLSSNQSVFRNCDDSLRITLERTIDRAINNLQWQLDFLKTSHRGLAWRPAANSHQSTSMAFRSETGLPCESLLKYSYYLRGRSFQQKIQLYRKHPSTVLSEKANISLKIQKKTTTDPDNISPN